MIKKNIKGYLKDKYIKNSDRFWEIESLKRELTPNKIFIIKKGILYYIEKEHIEKMSKKTIINNYGLGYFISHFTNKYLEKASGYIWGRNKNVDTYLSQISLGVYVGQFLFEKIKNQKVTIYKDTSFLSDKKEIEKVVTLKDLKEDYNLTHGEVYKLVIGQTSGSLREKLVDKRVELSDSAKVTLLSYVEDYIYFSVVIREQKLIEVYTKKELDIARTMIDFKLLPENIELTNSEILKFFNKTKEYIAVEVKARHSTMTAPRWYRKSENKKLQNKSYYEVERNIKNGDYDLVTAKAIKYVKNGSWYY